jgi:3-phosphoshikimate 1-carboxyvinyltransferase
MSTFKAITPLGSPVDATVRPPGSKSETIRALFVAALADGTSHLSHPLDSDDTTYARLALRRLGVEIDDSADPWVVTGSGGQLRPVDGPIDAGASGLTARALIALAPLVKGPTTIIGRDRLPERPMGGLVDALMRLGVEASASRGRLPVTVAGSGNLPGGSVEVAAHETTQFVTGLLLSAPLAAGRSTVTPTGLEGSHGYIEITLRVMRHFGATVEEVGDVYRVEATGYTGTDLEIEPDASAAVYPMVAAAITGGRVIIEGLGSGSLQPDLEIAQILKLMGCDVTLTDASTMLTATGGTLRPIDVDLSSSPDGSLAVAVACLFAEGQSRLRGLGTLRFKESDRLAALATEIERLGARAEIDGSDLIITPRPLQPARIETYGDHRIAMSFALVGLARDGIEVSDPDIVGKTWPGYWEMLENMAISRE